MTGPAKGLLERWAHLFVRSLGRRMAGKKTSFELPQKLDDAWRKRVLVLLDEAWEDGVITETESSRIEHLRRSLAMTREQMYRLSTWSAIHAAVRDQVVTDQERATILREAERARLSTAQQDVIRTALDDGIIDTTEHQVIEAMLFGGIAAP